MAIDLEQKQIRALANPRDTMVTLQRYDGSGAYIDLGVGQIILQHAYGDGMKTDIVAEELIVNLFYEEKEWQR